MAEIGVWEARKRLSELLQRVQQGEHFVITKHGRPIAELRPVRSAERAEREAIVERMKRFRATHDLEGATIRELIEDGRRF